MIYSGREFNLEEIEWINKAVESSNINRTLLSKLFCAKYNWLKPNNTFKDVSCRVAFLRMEKAGLIKLPAPLINKDMFKTNPLNVIDFKFSQEINLPAGKLDLSLELVNKKTTRLWNQLINEYHYLGYKTLPGAQLRYIVRHKDEIISCLGFGASAWKCAPRDNFIGWDIETRKKNLHLVVNNARFLILPWVKSKNLATKLLSMVINRLQSDWQERYNYKPALLETFVENARFTGTCYKAGNWIRVGDTKGRGKKDVKNECSVPIKSIWLYPLNKNYRNILKGFK